jgi:hypothetical protein
MALSIETFLHRDGTHMGASLFKALGHPFVVDKAADLVARLKAADTLAIFDPLGHAAPFAALHGVFPCAGVFVQDVSHVAQDTLGHTTKIVSDLANLNASVVLIAVFDSGRLESQIRHLAPDAEILSFDAMRLPEEWLSNRRRYLDPLNFATNFVFLRDNKASHTAVRSANYWSGYGADNPELWARLFSEDGEILAEWFHPLPAAGGTYCIDSREVRERFGLEPFAGSLFLHALRAKGHDVFKYALDTFGADKMPVLSATHDANAWPSDLYAGLPAPEAGERVVLWVQNSHPIPIPAGSVGLNVMGSKRVAWHGQDIPPFGTRAIDTSTLLPEAAWPQQIEIQAGRYFVRPRYEVFNIRRLRSRIAHANVERTDLAPDPKLGHLGPALGKGFILPLPILPKADFHTTILPTPMSTAQNELPLKFVVYNPSGDKIATKPLGLMPRADQGLIDVDTLTDGLDDYGHGELMYDFTDGGEADGWLHAIARFSQRASGHVAETSFGAHIYNTAATYKDEPQSYAGPPPGLSTRLFLRIGPEPCDTLCHLIYGASAPWHSASATSLVLTDSQGNAITTSEVTIPCGGSLLWRVSEMFDRDARIRAGDGAYVLVRDVTCRLFGFHGLIMGPADEASSAFSLDHMFGF